MSIAEVILKQLFNGGRMKVFSWGLHRPSMITEKLGGLVFQVSGMKHKGWVKVVLDFNDTYIVSIGKGMNVKETVEGLFYDQLTDTIDSMVETSDNYKEFEFVCLSGSPKGV